MLVLGAFLPALRFSHHKGDSAVESRSTCVASHLHWGGSVFDLTEIFTCLCLLSSWNTLLCLADRKEIKSCWSSSYHLLNYMVAFVWGLRRVVWNPLVVSELSTCTGARQQSELSNTPPSALPGCGDGNWWSALGAESSRLTSHQKGTRLGSNFSPSSLVPAWFLKCVF